MSSQVQATCILFEQYQRKLTQVTTSQRKWTCWLAFTFEQGLKIMHIHVHTCMYYNLCTCNNTYSQVDWPSWTLFLFFSFVLIIPYKTLVNNVSRLYLTVLLGKGRVEYIFLVGGVSSAAEQWLFNTPYPLWKFIKIKNYYDWNF
jgi:hypothetical protein